MPKSQTKLIKKEVKIATKRMRKNRAQRKAAKTKAKPARNYTTALRSIGNGLPADICQAYAQSLNDPFTHGGVKTGFGCMQGSEIVTTYYRGIGTANSGDGSYGIAVAPFLGLTGGSPIAICQAGLGTASWGATAWTNLAAVAPIAGSARCLSLGVRVKPLIGLSATPGVMWAGSINGTLTNITSNTLGTFIASPFMHPQPGYDGIVATSRPSSWVAFDFNTVVVAGSTSFTWDMSIPVVVASGYPNSCTLLVEVVGNFELLPGANLLGGLTSIVSNEPPVVPAFPSLEAFYAKTASLLSNSVMSEKVFEWGSAGIKAATRALLEPARGSFLEEVGDLVITDIMD